MRLNHLPAIWLSKSTGDSSLVCGRLRFTTEGAADLVRGGSVAAAGGLGGDGGGAAATSGTGVAGTPTLTCSSSVMGLATSVGGRLAAFCSSAIFCSIAKMRDSSCGISPVCVSPSRRRTATSAMTPRTGPASTNRTTTTIIWLSIVCKLPELPAPHQATTRATPDLTRVVVPAVGWPDLSTGKRR